jgi:hypothetical protein
MTPTRTPLASAFIRADAAQSQRAEVSPIASETDLAHVECIDYRMRGEVFETATRYPAERIEQARDSICADLLAILQSDRYPWTRQIVAAVDRELSESAAWRRANMPAEDADIAARELARLHAADVAYALDLARTARDAFGPEWVHTVPLTAWKARGLVHLSIIDSEHDPVALAAALDRVYGPEPRQPVLDGPRRAPRYEAAPMAGATI